MMTFPDILSYLGPFFRLAALFSVAPVLGTQFVPVRVRVGLAVVMTAIIVPLVPSASPSLEVAVVFQEILLGIAMGFILRLVFAAFELAGQVIAMQMGLGFAALMDPQTGVQVPLVAHFYTLLATLMFLALDGHLILIRVLVDSFTLWPVGETLGREGVWQVAAFGGHMFAGGVLIALPAIAALLAVNLTFGVMTRSAPQLNIFAVGFPISLTLGLFVLLFTLPLLLTHIRRLLGMAFQLMGGMG